MDTETKNAQEEQPVEVEAEVIEDELGEQSQAAQAAQQMMDAARGAAQIGAASVTDGLSAVRAVSAAKRAHASARDMLGQLEAEAAELAGELAHRREVEANYEGIIELQNKELVEADQALSDASAKKSELEAEHEKAAVTLTQLKEANERKLSPAREAATAARDAMDKAEQAAREARRALKRAQAQADDAQRSQDSRVQAAQRELDVATQRHQRAQEKLTELRRDPSAGAKDLTEKSGEVAAALAQVEKAKAAVQRASAETSQSVEVAQTHLYTQRQSLDVLEGDLAEAQDEETSKRKAYESLKAQTDAAEKEAADALAKIAANVKDAEAEVTGARGRITAANALIEEANDIHAHPEATDALAAKVSEAEASVEAQRAEVSSLEREETELRESTQKARTTFYGIIAAAALVVVVIILLVSCAG